MKKSPNHYFKTRYYLPVGPDGNPLTVNGEIVKAIPLATFCEQEHLTRQQVMTLLRRGELRGISFKKRFFVARCGVSP